MNITRPKRGEIWFVNLDPTVGREQAKKRPCLILSSNDFNNAGSDLCIAVPLTTRDRKNPLHIKIMPPEGGVMATSFALCEQIRAISHKRLSNHPIGRVNQSTLEALEFTLKVLLDFN